MTGKIKLEACPFCMNKNWEAERKLCGGLFVYRYKLKHGKDCYVGTYTVFTPKYDKKEIIKWNRRP